MTEAPNHVEVASRARRDLRRIGHADRERIVAALRQTLEAEPPPDNADIQWIAGRMPWLRLRIGDHRVLYRTLTAEELHTLGSRRSSLTAKRGYLVGRIVHRSELDEAVARLAKSPPSIGS